MAVSLQEKKRLKAVTEMVLSCFRFELTAASENKNLQCFHRHIFSLKSSSRIPPSPSPSEQCQKSIHPSATASSASDQHSSGMGLRVSYFRQHLANLNGEKSVLLVRVQFTKLEWHQVVRG